MLNNPPVQNFGAWRATSGIWQHITVFAWWHMQVIFNPSTIKLHIKNWILFSYLFHIITKKSFSDISPHIVNNILSSINLSWYWKSLPKIMPVVCVIMSAASQNHIHVSSSVKRNTLSNTTSCPDHSRHTIWALENLMMIYIVIVHRELIKGWEISS